MSDRTGTALADPGDDVARSGVTLTGRGDVQPADVASDGTHRSTERRYLSGAEKAKLGAITTWENRGGRTLTAHRTGQTKRWLPQLAAEVLALDPSFRLVSWSTPDTIMSDLTMQRATDQSGRLVTTPEARIMRLRRLGHLLHPTLGGPPYD